MSTQKNSTWTARKSVQSVSENLVTEVFKITGNDAAANDYILLTELPFGTTVMDCVVNVRDAAAAAAILDVGVYAAENVVDDVLTPAGAGYDIGGLYNGADLNSAVVDTTGVKGVLLGVPLDEDVFTSSDQYQEPIVIAGKVLAELIVAADEALVILTYKLP